MLASIGVVGVVAVALQATPDRAPEGFSIDPQDPTSD